VNRSAAQQATHVLRRELALERAGREALVAVGPFVLASVLLLGLGANARTDLLRPLSPTLVWLLVLSAALPLARGVRAVEEDEDCWDTLRCVVTPGALLAGKVAALWLQLAAAWAFAAVLAAAALGARWSAGGVVAGAVGTFGVAVDVTLFGLLIGSSRRRVGLLGVLVLPAALPALLAGTQAASPGVRALPWLALLLVFDLVATALAWALLPVLLEE